MNTLTLRSKSLYDPNLDPTGKETLQDARNMEHQAMMLEVGGKHLECIQLMWKALQVRCREYGMSSVSPESISEVCEAAERLVTKCNVYGVKCFKDGNYEVASTMFERAFKMTEEGSFPLREVDEKRRYLLGVTLNNYGCMERHRGHFSDALVYMKRSMQCTMEQSPVAFLNMSAVQTQLRLCEDAAESAMQAMHNLASAPEDPSLLAVAHHNLAMALELLDPARALEEYQSALRVARAVIGPRNETTLTIERNMMRFLQLRDGPALRGLKESTIWNSTGSTSWGSKKDEKQRNFKPEAQEAVLKNDAHDIFPHPFISSAADRVKKREVFVTRLYQPPIPSQRKPLVPKAPPSTYAERKPLPGGTYSHTREKANAPTRTAPPLLSGNLETSRTRSLQNPTKLPTIVRSSRELSHPAHNPQIPPKVSQTPPTTKVPTKSTTATSKKPGAPLSPMKDLSSVRQTAKTPAAKTATTQAFQKDPVVRANLSIGGMTSSSTYSPSRLASVHTHDVSANKSSTNPATGRPKSTAVPAATNSTKTPHGTTPLSERGKTTTTESMRAMARKNSSVKPSTSLNNSLVKAPAVKKGEPPSYEATGGESTLPSVSARRQGRENQKVQHGLNLVSYLSDRLEMLVVDEEELERKQLSVSVIQRAFRMYLARKLVRKMKESRVSDHALYEMREVLAARKLQRWVRNCLQRGLGGNGRRNKKLLALAGNRQKGAVRIQSLVRGWLTRRLFQRRKYFLQNSGHAARAIQSWWRQILAKRKLENLKKLHEDAKSAAAERERREIAAILLQSFWRARKVERLTRAERLQAREFRKKVLEARRLSSTCTIQSWWRLLKAREELHRLQEVHAAREARLREHQRKVDAATKLQSFGRMIIVRRESESLLTVARENAAKRIREKCIEGQSASKIQHAYRQYHARRLLRQLQRKQHKVLHGSRLAAAVAAIQRVGRGLKSRRELGLILWVLECEARDFSQRERNLAEVDSMQDKISVLKTAHTPATALSEPAVATAHESPPLTEERAETRFSTCHLLPDSMQVIAETAKIEQYVEKNASSQLTQFSPKRECSSDIFKEVSRLVEEERAKDLAKAKKGCPSVKPEIPFLETGTKSPLIVEQGNQLENISGYQEQHQETEIEGMQTERTGQQVAADDWKSFPVPGRVPGSFSEVGKHKVEDCSTMPHEEQAILEEAKHLRTFSAVVFAAEEAERSQCLDATEEELQILEERDRLDALSNAVSMIAGGVQTERTGQQVSGSLGVALAAERLKWQRLVAEETRLRKSRDAIHSQAHEYRLRRISAAESFQELRMLTAHPPINRCRRGKLGSLVSPKSEPCPEKLRERQLRLAMDAMLAREKAAVAIGRVLRGHHDRKYARALRAITAEYVEYRVEVDREEPPFLDYELLQMFTEMQQNGVKQARLALHVSAVQAFVYSRISSKTVACRVPCVPLLTKKSSAFTPNKSNSTAVLCCFVKVIQAKRERAIRCRAVHAYLERQQQKDAVEQQAARRIVGFLHSVVAGNLLRRRKMAVEKQLRCTWAGEKVASFLKMCFAKNELVKRRRLAEEKRTLYIQLEEILDNAAMRVQRLYRSYIARKRAEEQRDAKKRYWTSIQEKDEEIVAAVASIAADAAEQGQFWSDLGCYECYDADAEFDVDVEEFIFCVVAVQRVVRGWLARRHMCALRLRLESVWDERQRQEEIQYEMTGGADDDEEAELPLTECCGEHQI